MSEKREKILVIVGAAPDVMQDIGALLNLVRREDCDWMVIGPDAADRCPWPIQYMATFHPEDIGDIRQRREAAGGNTDYLLVLHEQRKKQKPIAMDRRSPALYGHPPIVLKRWKPSGSSVLLGAQAAIEIIGYRRIVLCGCPLMLEKYHVYRKGWEGNRDAVLGRVKSMSGWTMEFLGAPTNEWLNGGNEDMDEKSQEWQQRFETVWDPNGPGQYRLGSPGQRLVKRFLANVRRHAPINEYGSGTGRAIVEIVRTPGHCDHPINLVDIATNAMEDECRALLNKPGSKITFTHASLWNLPADFPVAEWGYCIDVLCFLPPEKLDDVLREIRRTCENLFVQVYDWDDVRCGMNLTTIKGDGPWWMAKLRQFWPTVTQEVSPESHRRYIFVCNSTGEKTVADGSVQRFRNAYADKTAWIVGRGPSLLGVKASDIGEGPVIVLNEAIMNVTPLNLPNDVFNIWRNGDPPADLLEHFSKGVTKLIVCRDPVLDDPPSSELFRDYSPRYVFGCKQDLACVPHATFSMKAALEIAVKIFGCREIAFVSFDSCTTGDSRTVLQNAYVQSEFRPGDYNEQCEIIFKRVKELAIPTQWITPGGEILTTGSITPADDGKPVKLNVGCGEVIESGYVNIDLHHELADVRMSAFELKYGIDTVDEVRSSHLLEHFGKKEVPAALREWCRVLKPGGRVWIEVPDLAWCLRNWLDQDEKGRGGVALDMVFGNQAHDGEFHKTGFTKASLTRLIEAAGFEGVEIREVDSHSQNCFVATAVKKKPVTA